MPLSVYGDGAQTDHNDLARVQVFPTHQEAGPAVGAKGKKVVVLFTASFIN